jgi:hypothetical protein
LNLFLIEGLGTHSLHDDESEDELQFPVKRPRLVGSVPTLSEGKSQYFSSKLDVLGTSPALTTHNYSDQAIEVQGVRVSELSQPKSLYERGDNQVGAPPPVISEKDAVFDLMV